jgi:hypothetical protein
MHVVCRFFNCRRRAAPLCVLTLALWFAWAGQGLAQSFTAGLTNIGSTSYPANALRRVSKLKLSNPLYRSLYNALFDAATGYAYFATAGGTNVNPGWIIKVDLNGPVPVELGAAQCQPGEFNLNCGVLDSANGYAYFGATANAGRVIKIALGAGTNPPTYLGSLALNPGETSPGGAVADFAHGYAYFGCTTPTGIVVKVALGAGTNLPTRVSALTLSANEGRLRRAVVDPANGCAYFASFGGTNPVVVKVALTPGTNPPVRVGATQLDPTESPIGSAVIDAANGYAYFGTYATTTAKVVKVALGLGSNPPVRLGALTLNPGEKELSTAVIDPAGGHAYFGSDHTTPANIYKVALGAGTNLPTRVGLLTLNPGTDPYPAMQPADADKYGEIFLQSSVFDPATGCAYFGTDTFPGQVVKVAVSQKGAGKATRIVIPQTAYVSDVWFYSHAAAGNVRLAIYDNSPAKALLWDSGSFPNSASNAWLGRFIAAGTPTILTLPPGTYWLAWQVDTTVDVPSYTSGAAGEGFFFNQPYGPFPALLGSVTNSSEVWSMYVRYSSSPPAAPLVTSPRFNTNGHFTLQATGQPGTPFRLQASTNLAEWVALATNVVSPGGLLDAVDPDATNYFHRFYRFVWP